MATFEVQVEGLTGLTIDGSSAPTTAELAEFLKDGVIDVTNRCIQLKPQTREDFVRGSSTQSSNGFATNGADIISVIREAGADGDTDGSTTWRNCRKVATHLRSRVVDTESLHFASKYNPVYIINNNSAVNVYPVPDGTNDGYRVYYINNEPKGDGLVDKLAAGHTTIGYFPKDRVYLVVIYAGIKSLENAMSAKSIPTISGDGTELTTVDDLDTDNTIDVHADQIEVDQWWSTVGHLIEGEEDIELASAQLQKISAYINAYQAQLQGNTTDYQWMQGRHQILSQQYERAFASMAPPQPQQVAGGRR